MGMPEWLKVRWWWVLTAVPVLVGYGIFGSLFSYGVFYGEIQKEFNSSALVTGWAQSVALFFSQVMSIPAQLMIPRFGIFYVVVSGTLVCGLGLLLTSFVPSIGFLYVTYGFCFGIATGIATKPMIQLVLGWVPIQYRMRATAIVTLGGTFGTLTLSPVIGLLIIHVGWRWTYRICSALIFIICLIVAPIIRKTPTEDPEVSKAHQEIMVKSKQEKELNTPVSQCDLLRFPEMWMLTTTVAVASCATGFTMINLVDFITKLGFTLQQGALTLSLNGGAELFSKIILSLFIDKLTFPKILLWPYGCILAAVTCVFMSYSTDFEVMLILSIVLGLVKGLINGTGYSLATEMFEHKYSASIASMSAAPAGIGYLLAALVSGFSYDLTGSYDYAMYACAGMFLIVGLLSLITQIWQKICAVERYQSMRRTSRAASLMQRGSYKVVSTKSTPV